MEVERDRRRQQDRRKKVDTERVGMNCGESGKERRGGGRGEMERGG